jgi:hypothetical protein
MIGAARGKDASPTHARDLGSEAVKAIVVKTYKTRGAMQRGINRMAQRGYEVQQ